MLGVIGEFFPVLVPSMHCSMKLLIVIIVEIYLLSLSLSVNNIVVQKCLKSKLLLNPLFLVLVTLLFYIYFLFSHDLQHNISQSY